MTYLIIAFVIAVALAPLSHFMPSKQQRKQARLREAAAVQGLFVEFRDLPRNSAPGAGAVRADTLYYGLRLRPSRGRERRRGAWLQEEGQWRPLGETRTVPEELLAMPETVLAASVDEGSCGIYWREAGDLSTVAELRRLLGDWGQQLTG
ncbi:hypothetical protein [Parahaliea aestuarii]|uniref:DUF2550 family protein n=1 Tax=Parahaliea aestuarii TaxID=1852021 RepID=A0A5C9A074_9GAMM|nr:hypothetical protein [Parahaliea aestuarii]TXS93180.1 hypothetical protein FVW59_04830 [Parahaliea aestuarii]